MRLITTSPRLATQRTDVDISSGGLLVQGVQGEEVLNGGGHSQVLDLLGGGIELLKLDRRNSVRIFAQLIVFRTPPTVDNVPPAGT